MTKKLVYLAAIAVILAFFAGCAKPEPVEVDVTVSEEVDSYDIPYANFVFNFNQDVTVDSIHVMVPDPVVTTPYKVPDIAGDYEGDTDNEFRIYWKDADGNDVVMKGTYSLNFWGTRARDEEPFDLSKDVTLQ